MVDKHRGENQECETKKHEVISALVFTDKRLILLLTNTEMSGVLPMVPGFYVPFFVL